MSGKHNQFHAAIYEDNTVLDKKTKHLICLATSLSSICKFCSKYALSVLQELEELRTTLMTVTATKIKAALAQTEDDLKDDNNPMCCDYSLLQLRESLHDFQFTLFQAKKLNQ